MSVSLPLRLPTISKPLAERNRDILQKSIDFWAASWVSFFILRRTAPEPCLTFQSLPAFPMPSNCPPCVPAEKGPIIHFQSRHISAVCSSGRVCIRNSDAAKVTRNGTVYHFGPGFLSFMQLPMHIARPSKSDPPHRTGP